MYRIFNAFIFLNYNFFAVLIVVAFFYITKKVCFSVVRLLGVWQTEKVIF